MKNSLLYHAFGLRSHECISISYEDKSIILDIQTRADKLRCSCCKSKCVTRSGCKDRLFRSVPIGSKQVFFRVKVQRLKCKCCGTIRQENIPFTTGKSVYTHKLANLVIELSRIGTIKDVANFLHLSWDTVKEIQKKYLKRHFSNPSLKEVEGKGRDFIAINV